jgi:hypothetical protein
MERKRGAGRVRTPLIQRDPEFGTGKGGRKEDDMDEYKDTRIQGYIHT